MKCQLPSKLEGVTGADVLRNITENAAIYWDCSDRHDKLIEAVKKK